MKAKYYLGAFLLMGVVAVGYATATVHGASLASHSKPTLAAQQINMVIMPDVRFGPDHKMHDAYTPTDVSAKIGQKVIITAYNYDNAKHSFTVPALHLNFVMPGVKHAGIPTVTTFSFTVSKAGSYHWLCIMPCDDWAMGHIQYMAGQIAIHA